MSTTDGPTLIPDDASAQEIADREAKMRQRKGWFPGLSDKWNALPRQTQWLILIVVVVIAYLLPILNPPLITTEPGNNWQIALAQMSVYALVAVGLNVVVGYAGLLDLGYVAFFALGSYTAAMLTSPDSPFVKIPYLWTIPVAMAVAMLFGVVLGVPTLRLRGDYLAIVT